MYLSRLRKGIPMLLVVLSILTVKAQNKLFDNVSIASPSAASLGKFVDIPVNYHTGSPKIDIPVYTIESGPLKLPISLSYHPSGLKVGEISGWVGAGWALNAGGVVTRNVRGAPDEWNITGTGNEKGHFSDYGYSSYLYNSYVEDWQAFATGRKDGEPDLFFFNFGGYAGKFYFSDDRQPILVPEQDLKIAYNYSGSGSISGFIFTVPNGTRYIFGSTPSTTDTDPVEITSPMNGENGYRYSNTISSWYLNKIESADKVFAINLSYQPEAYSYFSWSTFPISSADLSGKKEYTISKIFQNGVRLDKITFANGHMDFIAGEIRTDLSGTLHDLSDDVNASAKTLGTINITNDKNFCKKWQFYYSYFVDSTSVLMGSNIPIATDRKRLRLDSLQESSCNGAIKVPPYKFDYYTEQVPRRLSFGLDHWGYYNGVVSNNSLIPTYRANGIEFSGAQRQPVWPAMRGGALYRVAYPTGGYTNFEFEAHRANVSVVIDSWTDVGYLAIGFDGSNPRVVYKTITITIPGYYDVTLFSSNKGSDASFSLANNATGKNEVVLSASSSIPERSTSKANIFLQAGSYIMTVAKDCENPGGGMTGVGASANIRLPNATPSIVDTIVGGLRIKQIIVHDNITGKDKVTDFSYKAGNGSSGIVFSHPVYVQQVRNDLIKNIGFWNPSTGFEPSCSPAGCASCTGFPYYKSPNSLRPMSTTQGNHIGYSDVKVSEAGNGYSVYRYYTEQPLGPPATYADLDVRTELCVVNNNNYPPAPLPFVNLRGELGEEAHFREDNKLLSQKFYEYSFSTPVATTPAFIVTYFNNGAASNLMLGTKYDLYTSRKLQSIETENKFDPGSNTYLTTVITSDYGSNFHHEPTKISSVNSLGDSLIVNSKYVFDFRSTCDNVGTCTQIYTTACNGCSATYQSEANACGTSLCRTDAYLKYQKCMIQARINFVSCRRTNFTDSVNAFNTCIQASINSAGTELKPILAMQRSFQNELIEISNWKNKKLLGAAFNRFDFTTSPPGYIVPEKFQEMKLQALSSVFNNATPNGTSLSKDNRYKDKIAVKYYDGNLIQSLGKDGVLKSYIYDYNGALPAAIAINAPVDQIGYASFDATGKGGWSYSGNIVADSTSPGRGKCFNVATGGLSKSALITSSTYIISYWTKNASAYAVTGSQGGALKGRTIGGWTYFEHKVKGVSVVTISGTGLIDEVRIFPEDAQLRTFTYEPMLGITSESDAKDLYNYYAYDGLGRLRLIKDMNGNIRKMICYNFRGEPETCGGTIYGNVEISQLFIRNNCAPNYVAGSVRYFVKAGKYYADTQAKADSLAVADMAVNGQNNANQFGSCTCGGMFNQGYKEINGQCEKGVETISYQRINGRCYKISLYRFSDGTEISVSGLSTGCPS